MPRQQPTRAKHLRAPVAARRRARKKARGAVDAPAGKTRFATLFQTMPLGVVYQDAHGAIISANPAAEKILGLTLDQMRGRTSNDPHWRAIHEDGSDFPGETHPATVALYTGKPVRDVMMGVFNPQDDAYRWIQIDAVPIFRKNATRPFQVYTTFADRTGEFRASHAQRASEARYRAIVQDQTELICRFLPDNTLTFVNDAYCRYFGKTRDELIGSSFMPLIPPEDHSIILAETGRLSVATPVVTYEHRVILSNGETRWQQWTDRALFDERGNLIEYQSVGHDITEQKRVAEQLRESENRYHILFEQSPDATFLLDLRGHHLDVNSRGVEMLGYTRAEMLGLSVRDTSDQVVQSERVIERLLNGEHIPAYERIFRKKNGELISVELTVNLVRDLRGNPIYIQSVARDITERKQIEHALRESEARYRLLANATSDVIWTRDLNLDLTFISPSVKNLTGYSVDESYAQTFASAFTPASFQRARAMFARFQSILQTAPTETLRDWSHTEELQMQCKNGSTVWTEARLNFLFDAHGKPNGLLGVSRDITERRRAEEQVRASEARYRLISENAADVIWVMDPLERRFTYISPSVEKLRGYSVAEVLAQPLARALTPESLRRVSALMAERIPTFLAKGIAMESFAADLMDQPRKDGSIVQTEVTTTYLFNARGQLEIVGVSRDITERKRTETLLRASEERFRNAMDATSDGLWDWDVATGAVYYSPGYFRMLGYAPDELSGTVETWLKLLHPDDRARALADNEACLRNETTTINVEYRMRARDGSWRWILGRGRATRRDTNGYAMQMIGTHVDITERKTAEAEHEDQRRTRELALLYEKTRDLGVYLDLPVLARAIVDRATELLAISASALYLLNADRNVFELRATRGVTLETDRRIANVNPAMLSGTLTAPNPFTLPGYVFQMHAALIYSENLLGVLVVGGTAGEFSEADTHHFSLFAERAAAAIHTAQMFADVRLSREHAHSLSYQLLDAQETERRAIARELHDEIGQQLTSVQLNLQTLDTSITDSENQDRLEETMQTIENVLEQVRDLSRTLRPAILDDFGLAPALKWYVERQAKRAGFQFEFHADAFAQRLPEEVETVCFRVAQETVTNIVRHSHAHQVLVELREQPNQIILTIQDDGRGFDVADALARAVSGNSFGLLGMRERVALVGGEVAIQSAPQQGTRVCAQIPLDAPTLFVERRNHTRDDDDSN
jgi:PAS domain S-box-containing protein